MGCVAGKPQSGIREKSPLSGSVGASDPIEVHRVVEEVVRKWLDTHAERATAAELLAAMPEAPAAPAPAPAAPTASARTTASTLSAASTGSAELPSDEWVDVQVGARECAVRPSHKKTHTQC
jgi:hypothetical protein